MGEKLLGDIDLIASGYEWVCPLCTNFNKEIEITEKVKCKKCKKEFGVATYEHAFK